jgi:hypothetical protein
MGVEVAPGPSFAFSKPPRVVPGGLSVAPTSRSYDVMPDGTRFLLIEQGSAGEDSEGIQASGSALQA